MKFANAIEELQMKYGKIETTKAFVSFQDRKARSSVVSTSMKYRPSEMQEAIACYMTAMVELKQQ